MALDKEYWPCGHMQTYSYGTTESVAIEKYQLVAFGATTELVTGTTSAGMVNAIGRALEAIASGDAGATKMCEVELLTPGTRVYLKAGGTVTAGALVEVEGTDGRVVDMGAAAAGDGSKRIGRALTSGADGELVLVMIG